MGRTRTRGIILENDGTRTVNKIYKGERIYARLGHVTQREAEQWLENTITQWRQGQAKQSAISNEFVFADGAAQYLKESQQKPSADVIGFHVKLLLPFIGLLPLEQVHDATLEAFKEERLEGLDFGNGKPPKPVSPTTVNRSLEVVSTILNRAARAWRDEKGRPWLSVAPPLITRLDEKPRPAYPMDWEEQDLLFQELPAHLHEMASFAVTTGLRDDNVCGLKWSWEKMVPEVGRSVFIIPAGVFKTKVPHVVILNDAAWSIIESKRKARDLAKSLGEEVTDFVFAYTAKGKTGRIETINNNGWQNARKRVGLTQVRVHDLRHTYASRLRQAGVVREDRAALLGHEGRSMPEHYATADIGRLIELSNRVLDRAGTRTLLRVVNE